MLIPSTTPLSTTAQDYQKRRQLLAQRLPAGTPVLLASGQLRSRNYPANHYAFRACSHFLYYCGWNQPGVAAVLQDGKCTLYYHDPGVEEAVWEGAGPDPAELSRLLGLDGLGSVGDLKLSPETLLVGAAAATVASRPFDPSGVDNPLVEAVIALRLCQDAAAQRQLRDAARITVKAHLAGRLAIQVGLAEQHVLAAMLQAVVQEKATTSFHPIVSVYGETLHNPHCGQIMRSEDMLLIDFGAENEEGWAGDLTRTYPVSGHFSARQKEIYEVVVRANQAAIAACRPGAEFRALHDLASLTIAEGLVALGLLRGDPAELVARGAHTLFFPHGLGHLMGLDVHDMEDLGDRAGYAPGRRRSEQFGTCYLRLDRTLTEGMSLTIEPGFYWIPALLDNPERTAPFQDCLDLAKVAQYREVRGIRIEDDVLITADGAEVLSAQLPKL